MARSDLLVLALWGWRGRAGHGGCVNVCQINRSFELLMRNLTAGDSLRRNKAGVREHHRHSECYPFD